MEFWILTALQSMRATWLNGVMIAFTHVGDAGLFWILLGLVLMSDKRSRMAGLSVWMALAFSGLLCNAALKPLIARVRPYDVFSELTLLVPAQHDFSFPSGHTSSSFAAATALWRHNPKLGWAVWPIAGLISFSRLYLSLHYPTDVLAGAIIGVACGWLAAKVVRS